MSGVSAMSDRIRVIIKDSGRMLNEMSDGNFAIDTECEEVYTGAFTDLLTGIRKMNEEIPILFLPVLYMIYHFSTNFRLLCSNINYLTYTDKQRTSY